LHNKQNIITFVMSNKKEIFSMLDEEEKKEKELLEKELIFYLNYHKEVTSRSKKIKSVFDKEIEEITQRLKEIGK